MSDDNDELGSNLGPAPASAPRAKRAKPSRERVWIRLEENEEIPPTGQFFGLNGEGTLIKPGEPVHVDASILEILDHAVVSMPVIDPSTRRVIGHRERMRFPYTRVAAPDVTE
jgi:hypothetical protein